MKPTADFASLLEGFFTKRLMSQRRASPHTIASYRDTFRLLLSFTEKRLHRPPSALSFDATAPGGGRNYLQGGNRAKGWDLEFYGSPLAKMTMTGGYSLMDTSLTDATAIAKNPELPGVPRHKVVTFISYDLRGNGRDGLRLKGGITYQTSMVGRATNNYRLAGGFLIDLGADYTFGRWNLALNINNVTDKILPSFGIGQPSNNVSPPRNFLLSLRRQF